MSPRCRALGDTDGTLSLLITGDEEGYSTWGTPRIIDWLNERQIRPDMILIGEPTSVDRLGDTVKIGRRGSVNMWIEAPGRAGSRRLPAPHEQPDPSPRPSDRRAGRASTSTTAPTPSRRPTSSSPASTLRRMSATSFRASATAQLNIRFNNLQKGDRPRADGRGDRRARGAGRHGPRAHFRRSVPDSARPALRRRRRRHRRGDRPRARAVHQRRDVRRPLPHPALPGRRFRPAQRDHAQGRRMRRGRGHSRRCRASTNGYCARYSRLESGSFPSFRPPSQASGTALVPAAGSYTNPVLDKDFPDPAVIHAPDGLYYAYATQTLRDGQWINIQVARSDGPRRLGTSRRRAAGKAGLGADDPGFLGAERHLRWLDLFHVLFGDARRLPRTAARPLRSRSPRRRLRPGRSSTWACRCCLGMGFEYIDPMAYDDPATGKRLLYWGSGFQPIKVQELAEDRMSFAPGSEPVDLIWPNPARRAPSPAGRGLLGDPPRRFLLSLLLRRQLLWTRRPLRRDGRPLRKRDRTVRDARTGQGCAAQPDAVQKRALARAGPQLRSSPTRPDRSGSCITRST